MLKEENSSALTVTDAKEESFTNEIMSVDTAPVVKFEANVEGIYHHVCMLETLCGSALFSMKYNQCI